MRTLLDEILPTSGNEYEWTNEMETSTNDTTRTQQALKTLLNLPLQIDGVAGKNTKTALKTFQNLWGLSASQTNAFLFQMYNWVNRPGYAPIVFSIGPFKFNDADINIDIPPKIATAAKAVSRIWSQTRAPMNVLVIGHADKAGSESYNMNLGMERAKRVTQHLHTAFECLAQNASDAQTLKRMLRWSSVGESFPLPGPAENSRRVEIIVMPVPPSIYP